VDDRQGFIEAIGLNQPQTQSPPNAFVKGYPRDLLGGNGDWANGFGQANSFVERLKAVEQ
jgi:hypothetical protein